jgi:uncharacterized damage-inducible protein DinB
MDKRRILERLKKSQARTLAACRWGRKLLATSYGAGKWTAREVLAHLADSELVFLTRLRFMLAEENPPVASWDADHWASTFSYRTADLADVRDTYALMRRTFLKLYKAADERDLARGGRHPEYPNYTVGRLAEYMLRHNEHHLTQLDAIKAGKAWVPSGEYAAWRASMLASASSREPVRAK